MAKDFNDPEFDDLMRQMLASGSLDDAAIDEITSSPKVWWAIKREIAAKPFGAVPSLGSRLFRLASIAIPAAAAAAIAVAAVLPLLETTPQTASVSVAANSVVGSFGLTEGQDPSPVESVTVSKRSKEIVGISQKRSIRPSAVTAERIGQTVAMNETRTDFIPLSYAPDAESGQIVRVKVSSAMLASLGLSDTVRRSGQLIDAEVLVGDDGLTRAIRFIR